MLSDVYLIAENGQEWRHGDLAALGLRTSANSPIYASNPTQPSDLLIQVLYIAYDSIGYWASVGLNSNYKWVRVFWSGISYVQVLNGKFDKGDARTRSIVEVEIGIAPSD